MQHDEPSGMAHGSDGCVPAAGLAARMNMQMPRERKEHSDGCQTSAEVPSLAYDEPSGMAHESDDCVPAAGLAARMSTQMRREREEQRRLMQEEADFERIMSFNLGPLNSLDAEQEVRGHHMPHPLGQVRVVLSPSLYWGSNPLGMEDLVDAAFSKAGARSLRLLGPCSGIL